jgi:K+-sensing histidine kinase KdpD
MNMIERLDRQPIKHHIAIGILFASAVGFLDYRTGFKFRTVILYLLPIAYVTWFIGKKTGVVFSTLLLLTIPCANMLSGKNYYNFPFELWNMAMYFALFITMTILLSKLRSTLQQRASLTMQLQNALNAIEELSGILPICANCKKIRDDQGYWHDVDVYISRHTKVEFTHGICAECANKLYPSLFDKIGK